MKLANKNEINRLNKKSSILFLLCLSFLLLFAVSVARIDFFYEHFENFDPIKIRLVFLSFLFLLLGYGVLSMGKKQDQCRWDNLFLIMIIALAVMTPPFLSRDAGTYLLGAKNLVGFHVNPYVVGLDAIKANTWLGDLGQIWTLKYPFAYGPLFLLIVSLSAIPNFAHLIGAVYFYKIIVFIAYLISIKIFYEIIKILSLDRYLVFLYAVNPAILVNGVAEGHNEMFIILFLLLTIYFILKGQEGKSYLFWLASVFIKYNALIFLPIFWKKNRQISAKMTIFSILGILGAFLLMLVAFFGSNIMNFVNNALMMNGQLQMCLYRCFPIASATDILAGEYSSILRLFLFFLLYVFFLFKFLFRDDDLLKFLFRSFLSMVFVLTKWISPWYVLPIIPIGLLIDGRKYRILVLLLTAYSLFHFFGII